MTKPVIDKQRIMDTPLMLYMDYLILRYNEYLKLNTKDINITRVELLYLFLINYQKSVSQRQLADLLMVSEANVTKMLKKLEKKGLISRNVDKSNNSRKLVSLTDEGERINEQLMDLTTNWESTISSSFKDDDVTKLKHYLCELYYNS